MIIFPPEPTDRPVSPPYLLPIQMIPAILRPECEANYLTFSSPESYESLNVYLQHSVNTHSARGQTYLFILSYKISPYGGFHILYHKSLQTFLFSNIFRFWLTFYQVLCVSMLHNSSNNELCVCHFLKTICGTTSRTQKVNSRNLAFSSSWVICTGVLISP